MSNQQPYHDMAKPFIDYLGRFKNDRGALAHLRGGISESRRPRTWPLLGGFSEKVIGNRPFEVVAALWANAPELDSEHGNMGETLRRLVSSKEASASMDIRFRRLLSCTREEIVERVAPMVRMAQGKGERIDYSRILSDLLRWGEFVQIAWARSYWQVNAPAEIKEVS